MSSKLHLGGFVICCLSLTLPAAAQLDSSALRAKYGSPRNRETFHMPARFDLIVDYGDSGQVCRVQVPALMPTNATVRRTSEMRQRMYEFLLDLVPDSMRGNEQGRFVQMIGAASMTSIQYEHVTINELQNASEHFRNDTITVRFQNDECQKLADQ